MVDVAIVKIPDLVFIARGSEIEWRALNNVSTSGDKRLVRLRQSTSDTILTEK